MRAVDRAYDIVRSGIIAGRYAPESRLTEQEVAEAAGVSRTPAREALRRLHSEGLVRFTPNQGAVVASWSDADADEIFDLRRLLESHGAARAAEYATPDDIAELKACAEAQIQEARARAPGHLERIAELNSRFHRRLREAAASPRLAHALTTLLDATLVLRTFNDYTPENLVRSAAHHLELVRAIEARDAEWASSVMRAHILAAKRTLRRRASNDGAL
jgi:DNA-binding GntR family transcriptional regulator